MFSSMMAHFLDLIRQAQPCQKRGETLQIYQLGSAFQVKGHVQIGK